jgi:hypothetical protein
MRVRILSEWSGAWRCGTVCDVPDAEAQARISTGWAEPVAALPPAEHDDPPLEMAIVPTGELETAVSPTKRPRGRPRKVVA